MAQMVKHLPTRLLVHGVFQARVLDWVAISFSRGSSQPRDQTQVSRIVSKTLYRLSYQGSPGKEQLLKATMKEKKVYTREKTIGTKVDKHKS